MRRRWLRFAVLPALGLGCGAQVDPDYQGEPLLTLRGQVIADAPTTARPSEAALLWMSVRPPAISLVGTSVAVKGDFPMGFEIKIFTPPPARALAPTVDQGSSTEPLDPAKTPAVGAARIVALAANANHDDVQLADVLGTSMDTAITYNSQAIDPASPGGQVLAQYSLPLEAGYHLLSVKFSSMEERLASVRCSTGGVCQKLHLASGSPAFEVALFQRDYDECMTATPGATTCDAWATPATNDELKQSVDCYQMRQERAGTNCGQGATYSTPAPGSTTTVTMGASPLDRWQ